MLFFVETIVSALLLAQNLPIGMTNSLFIGAHSHETVPIYSTDPSLLVEQGWNAGIKEPRSPGRDGISQ